MLPLYQNRNLNYLLAAGSRSLRHLLGPSPVCKACIPVVMPATLQPEADEVGLGLGFRYSGRFPV
jgi:hypothetical protein